MKLQFEEFDEELKKNAELAEAFYRARMKWYTMDLTQLTPEQLDIWKKGPWQLWPNPSNVDSAKT